MATGGPGQKPDTKKMTQSVRQRYGLWRVKKGEDVYNFPCRGETSSALKKIEQLKVGSKSKIPLQFVRNSKFAIFFSYFLDSFPEIGHFPPTSEHFN